MQSVQLHIPCAELAQRYLRREPLAQIAASYGCSSSTIIRRLHRCGIPQHTERRLRRDVPEQKLRQLYHEDRLPLTTIAQMLTISVNTVVARLRWYNIPRRHSVLSRRVVEALWRNGLSIEAIAQLLDVRSQAIIALTHQIMPNTALISDLPISASHRAYLSGLRRGWMESERNANGLITIYIATNDQASHELFLDALAVCKPQQVRLKKRFYTLIAQVPSSWGFLSPQVDELPSWIRAVPELVIIFFAGLFDGAGALSIGHSLQLSIDVPWPRTLEQLASELRYMDFAVEVVQQQQGPTRLWRLRVVGGTSRLLHEIAPFLRHRRRRQAVSRALRRR